MSDTRLDILQQLFRAAVTAAQPGLHVAANLPPPPQGRTLVLGAGKAAAAMALALDAAWPKDAPLAGLVVTRYGHNPAALLMDARTDTRIEIAESAHPVPDEAGMVAAQRMLDATRWLTEKDLVIVLMSGGGSALMTLPAPGMTLEEKQAIHEALIRSGATITEMNTVRKHLSGIKGGRLARACGPAQVVTLLISDVPGDDPSVIASGPTILDNTTCIDALLVLDRYGVDVPPAVRAGLESGDYESPGPEQMNTERHSWKMLATPRMSLEAAADHARMLGVPPYILGDTIEGESSEVARVMAGMALSVSKYGTPVPRPCVLLSGGETTVTLPENATDAQGGRSTEFLLSLAMALQGEPTIWALACDTDGLDGTGDHAGAMITPDTLARAASMGLSARAHLQQHRSAPFFTALGDTVVTGPTFTNVNDFRAILVL